MGLVVGLEARFGFFEEGDHRFATFFRSEEGAERQVGGCSSEAYGPSASEAGAVLDDVGNRLGVGSTFGAVGGFAWVKVGRV